jgi:hypothetical protein
VVAGRHGPGMVVSHSEDLSGLSMVRFPSGQEQEFARDDLRIRKLAQTDVLGPAQSQSMMDGILDERANAAGEVRRFESSLRQAPIFD